MGELELRILDFSPMGFMVADASLIERGARILVTLPLGRRMESVCIWRDNARGGLVLERRISEAEFARMFATFQASSKSRAAA
jgi:hypothetical protein